MQYILTIILYSKLLGEYRRLANNQRKVILTLVKEMKKGGVQSSFDLDVLEGLYEQNS